MKLLPFTRVARGKVTGDEWVFADTILGVTWTIRRKWKQKACIVTRTEGAIQDSEVFDNLKIAKEEATLYRANEVIKLGLYGKA